MFEQSITGEPTRGREIQWPKPFQQQLPVIVANNVALVPKPSNAPPHPPVSKPLTAIPLGFQFSFQQATVPQGYTNVISSYRVYRNTSSNNFSGAQLIRTIVHDPTHQGAVTFQDNTGGGKQYYYFLSSVDTTGKESPPVSLQSSAVTSGNSNPNIANAVGSTASPNQTSSTYAVIPEMTVTITTTGNKVFINFSGTFLITGTGTGVFQTKFAVFKDGVQLTQDYGSDIPTDGLNNNYNVAITYIDTPTAASHTYDIRWAYNGVGTAHLQGGSSLASGITRSLQVVELG